MELFNLEQLQEKLGISDRTLLRYLANGELTGVKIGREWRFTEEDIAAFVATRRKKTEDELAEKRQRTGKTLGRMCTSCPLTVIDVDRREM